MGVNLCRLFVMHNPKTHKRCQAVQNGGCGQWLPFDQFASRKSKVPGNGMLYASWCIQCQKERDRKRRKLYKKKSIKEPLQHTGPKPGTPEHMFFCRRIG